ncbi:hydroxyacylglutathione hydrolase [Methylophaga sp. 41_12_T18]|nr:hydroxyacylglutathione hydrolase [Methylophaga sp. 41_12_T18]
MLSIQAVPALTDNYIWLIKSEDTDDVIIIDPGESAPVISVLNEQHLTPVAILNTHYHYDHIDGIAALVERYQLPVFGPKNSFIPKLTHPLEECQQLTIHPSFPDFKIINIPGHTAQHIGYLVDGMLFCGDTLFAAGCGRLLGGTAAQLFHSLQQICQLPRTTKIFCSHEYTLANLQFALTLEPNNAAINQRILTTEKLRHLNQPSLPTTLELEFETNPFLRCDHHDVIHAAESFCTQTLTNPLDVFTVIRAWKDSF